METDFFLHGQWAFAGPPAAKRQRRPRKRKGTEEHDCRQYAPPGIFPATRRRPAAGRDPQLERGVQEVLKMLEQEKQVEVAPPAFSKPARGR